MDNFKVPSDELTGEANLNGRYRVSFDINIAEDDCLGLSDIVQSIAAGFGDDATLYKLSNISLEKVTKEGTTDLTPRTFKTGDLVCIAQDVSVTVALSHTNGLYIVGAKSLSAEPLGDIDITIPKGTHARVNQVTAEEIELIDFDTTLETPLMDDETGDFKAVPISLDSVIFLSNSIGDTLVSGE